jgi:hypothetical protein
MPKLEITRFRQDPNCCAIATCAMLARFYNPRIEYSEVVEFAVKHFSKRILEDGLCSGEICRLLNLLGFQKVTLVTADNSIIDYSWSKFGRRQMLRCFDECLKRKKSRSEKGAIRCLKKWMGDMQYDNEIVIDYGFGNYIRKWIRRNKPLGLSFNWTVFFKFAKDADSPRGGVDVYNGLSQDHAVVAYGYDKRGVNICDPHHLNYTYRRAKYRKGFYRISWENLMTIMGTNQDLYLPERYESSWYEWSDRR